MKRTLRLTASAIALAAIALYANPGPAQGFTVFE